MVETINSEWLKTETELSQILRWEDDGGAMFETVNPLDQVAKTNTPRPMDVSRGVFLFKEHPYPVKIGNTIKRRTL